MAMPLEKVQRFVFVFHANAGGAAAFVDSVKKLLMLKGCALCDITHGLLGEKSEWKTCKESLGAPVDYMHLDEIPADLARIIDGQTPCVLAEAAGGYVRLLGPDELERCCGSVADLKGRLLYHAIGHRLELPFNLGG